MSAMENFAKLKDQVEDADRDVKAAADQNQAEVQTKVEKARREADEHAAEQQAKSPDAAGGAGSHWSEMQADLNRHLERARQRIDAKKATVDANEAKDQAAWAEADANDAIAFAISAINEAEYATLDAILARKNAAQLAATSS